VQEVGGKQTAHATPGTAAQAAAYAPHVSPELTKATQAVPLASRALPVPARRSRAQLSLIAGATQDQQARTAAYVLLASLGSTKSTLAIRCAPIVNQGSTRQQQA